ncbi:MAG: hypothetical protein DI628_05680 [Blastochloris viridis]|uniref:Uncharacterized protein n=1 Tax=Blastochloris viridis TaxID=1079 RepID=A0A6N4RBI2_BLAVI|nr:MAG: hypothetical protein DI628_05680 [Blastochloris viridis]
MLVKLRDVQHNVRQNVKPENLLWTSLGMLLLGNFASTTLDFGAVGGVVALLGIVVMVTGLVLMGDLSRDDIE